MAGGGETFLWRAVREAGAPAVPPRFATVHRRGGDMLDLPTGAGDSRSESVERRDPDLFGRSMRRLDDAERSARAVFASAFQLTDTRSGANR